MTHQQRKPPLKRSLIKFAGPNGVHYTERGFTTAMPTTSSSIGGNMFWDTPSFLHASSCCLNTLSEPHSISLNNLSKKNNNLNYQLGFDEL